MAARRQRPRRRVSAHGSNGAARNGAQSATATALGAAAPAQESARERRSRGSAQHPAQQPAGPPPAVERPRAPWHPLPLSELLVLAGAVAIALSILEGPERHALALAIGIVAVLLGTLEVTLREHLAGYRSHALLLAVLPAIALHSGLVVAISALTAFPRIATAALLALDAAVVYFLYRLLRARYIEARKELLLRALAGRR